MHKQDSFTYSLINPETKNLAFKVSSLNRDNSDFNHLQRLSLFTLVFVESAPGSVKADVSTYELRDNTVFSFSPYQPFVFEVENEIKGKYISFHPEFLCIYNQIQDVACNGVLFHNPYSPSLVLDDHNAGLLNGYIQQMISEFPIENFGQCDMLISLLRIMLINMSRIKLAQSETSNAVITENKQPFILQDLKEAIEHNFRTKHSASEYAELLSISANSLAKICKQYYDKTLTNLISQRIIIEAKRELYLTSKPIKQIAYELGYNDEYYFSRFFKKNADISPQYYRETVGFSSPN